MISALVLAVLVAAAPAPIPSPTASPNPATSPSAKPSASPLPPLKEIYSVTVVNTYCTSFYRHFNATVRPLIANDITLERVSVSLDNIDTLFSENNWEQRFYDERLKMERYVAALQENNETTQREVNELRDGAKLTTDPVRVKEMRQLAQELQRAVDKQKQMASDLLGITQGMMDYYIDPEKAALGPIGNFNLEDLKLPKDAKDIKSYLRFNGMRDVLKDAEIKSATVAQDIAEKFC
ncbi:MAG: hypothetical protein JOZ38_06985 [Candidatus Eremiobacteraeota bacterium]|nr:hypothetical protein [Candidatus Eremiobacteraeota bacterium]